MGMFGRRHYMDSDGEIHRIKDIPEFGVRGKRRAPQSMGEAQAVIDGRIARKKYDAQLRAERERAEKIEAARRRKAERDRLKYEKKEKEKLAKAAKKAAKKP